jgi:hypothetical protein
MQRSCLFGRGAGRLEDRSPAGHLALDELLQSFRGALGSSRQHAAEVEETLLGVVVLESLHKGIVQLLDDLGRGALGANMAFQGLT